MEKHCVLLTGGAGYIGSHTAAELLEQDYEVSLRMISATARRM